MKKFVLLIAGAFLFTACGDDSEPTIEEVFCSEAISCDQSYQKKINKNITGKELSDRRKASKEKCVAKMITHRDKFKVPECEYYYDMYLECKIDKTRKKTKDGEKYLKYGCAVMFESNDVSEEFCKSEQEALEACLSDNGGIDYKDIHLNEIDYGVKWKE